MKRTVLFLLNFSVFSWFAISAFVSVVAILLFTGFPTQTAADVMGRIFPAYGWILSACSIIFAGFVVYAESKGFFHAGKIGASLKYLASGALIINLAQSAYILPRSSALRVIIKEGRMKGDFDSILGVSGEFDFLHSLSTKLNAASMLMALLLCILLYLSIKTPETSRS